MTTCIFHNLTNWHDLLDCGIKVDSEEFWSFSFCLFISLFSIFIIGAWALTGVVEFMVLDFLIPLFTSWNILHERLSAVKCRNYYKGVACLKVYIKTFERMFIWFTSIDFWTKDLESYDFSFSAFKLELSKTPFPLFLRALIFWLFEPMYKWYLCRMNISNPLKGAIITLIFQVLMRKDNQKEYISTYHSFNYRLHDTK